MSLSRRVFFARAFSKTAQEVPKILPRRVQEFFGLEEQKPLSAEQAALALAKLKKKNSRSLSSTDSINPTPNEIPLSKTELINNSFNKPSGIVSTDSFGR